MKRKQKWVALFLVLCICTLCVGYTGNLAAPTAAESDAKGEKTVHYKVKKGGEVYFSAIDLEQKLGFKMGTITEIAILNVPDASSGTLYLDNEPVLPFDIISRADIQKLRLIPKGELSSAQFTFVPKGGKSETVHIDLHFVDPETQQPVAEDGATETFQNSAVSGDLRVRAGDISTVHIEVTKAPEKGTVHTNGIFYTYEPYPGQKGKDRFSFVAVDQAGYRSAESTVEINIAKNKTGIDYVDMEGDPSHYAALKLAQEKIWQGVKIGEDSYFFGDRPMTKGELLLVMLKVSGLPKEMPACVNTELMNDTDIPVWFKPYVKLGLERRLIKEDAFDPDSTLTKAEMVVYLDRLRGGEDATKGTFQAADADAIPTWAVQSFDNLAFDDMILTQMGKAEADSIITRSDAAQLLFSFYQTKTQEKEK